MNRDITRCHTCGATLNVTVNCHVTLRSSEGGWAFEFAGANSPDDVQAEIECDNGCVEPNQRWQSNPEVNRLIAAVDSLIGGLAANGELRQE